MGAFLRKYGTGTGADVYIPIIKRGVVDFAVSGDWSPASGDVKVSQDGGAAANIGTLPVAVTMGNGAYWKFVFSNAELQCKVLTITVADSATKAVEDQCFNVETYGHASAMYRPDFTVDALGALMPTTAGRTLAVDASNKAPATIAAGDLATDSITASAVKADAVTKIVDGVLAVFSDDTGTAQAGASGTITLRSGAVATDDYYNGAVVCIYGGTGAGQSRKITDYVGSTKVVTVDSNWVTNPDSTSTYFVIGRIT